MPITQDELAERIKEVRKTSGLTQAEVAEHLGISRPSVAQIEAGRRKVSSLELDRIAYLFGKEVRDFLRQEFEPESGLAAVFRVAPDLAEQADLADALRQGMRLGREITKLEELLDIPSQAVTSPPPPLTVPTSKWEAIQQGERAAEEERRRLALGEGPIDDVAELLEGVGIRTAWIELPQDVSGLTLRQPDEGLFVVVNSVHHWLRRRFSYAHELAHVRLDHDRLGTISRTSDRDDLREVRANAFAAAFLLPVGGVRQYVERLGKGQPTRPQFEVFDGDGAAQAEGRAEPGSQKLQIYDVVQLAHHFKVSRIAALYRVRNLRLITENELEELKAQEESSLGQRWERFLGLEQPDHTAAREEFRHRFLGLAVEAYRRDRISRGKLVELARLVGFVRDKVLEHLDEAGLLDDEGVEVLLPEE